eukprot:scaffold33011_cov16-Tisochrysis_lutea.AAC.1
MSVVVPPRAHRNGRIADKITFLSVLRGQQSLCALTCGTATSEFSCVPSGWPHQPLKRPSVCDSSHSFLYPPLSVHHTCYQGRSELGSFRAFIAVKVANLKRQENKLCTLH